MSFKNADIQVVIGPGNPEIGRIVNELCEELGLVYIYSYLQMSWWQVGNISLIP